MIIPNASQHLNFAVLVIILLSFKLEFSTYNELGIFIIATLLGSLLPDIDHKESTLGKILPFWILHKIFGKVTKIFKHGGITHTVLVNGLIYAVWYFTGNIILFGIATGYATHLYIDHIDGNKLNMLWYPLGRRK